MNSKKMLFLNALHYCSCCDNAWAIREGFNLKTGQCKECDKYDLEEPARKLEAEKQLAWWESTGKYYNFKSIYN